MKLSNDSFWASLFYFCDEVIQRATTDRFYRYDRPARTDVCQYIRVVFLWAPLLLLFQFGAWAAAALVLVYYPFTQFGYGYAALWLSIGGFVALVCGAVWLSRRIRHGIKAPKAMSEAGEIAHNAYRGFKDAYCPIITLREPE